jgi:uncharacterized protein with GYD domain
MSVPPTSQVAAVASVRCRDITSIKDGPARLDAGKEALKAFGCELKAFYLTMGRYDIVAISEAPDDAAVTRHRLSRAGDRQLNCCLHTMAITQIARDTPGRAYYRRKRASCKSHREALRCRKRRLSDAVYRQLLRDATTRTGAGPAGHAGATLASSAAAHTP